MEARLATPKGLGEIPLRAVQEEGSRGDQRESDCDASEEAILIPDETRPLTGCLGGQCPEGSQVLGQRKDD